MSTVNKKSHRTAALLLATAFAAAAGCGRNTQDAGTGIESGAPEVAKEVIDAAATALGGAERIAALRNLTLIGYGHYAYQYGGGNITGLPDAPMKLIAANDLRRVYDLEHGRIRLLERRNNLFPFAIYSGHSFAQLNQVLDGDIAYDVRSDGPVRIGATVGLGADGPRERRMWMHSNPVV